MAVCTGQPDDGQEWVDKLVQKRFALIVHRAYGIPRSVMADAARFRMIQQSPCVYVRFAVKWQNKLTTLIPAQVELPAGRAPWQGSLSLFYGVHRHSME